MRMGIEENGDWGGVPPPHQPIRNVWGSVVLRKLPQRGMGQSYGRKRFWYIFSLKEHKMMATDCLEYGALLLNE